MLDIAAVQSHAVAASDFVFQNRGQFSDARMQHAIVLHVRAIADANVVHVAARNRAEPDGGLFAYVYVANHLRAVGDECGSVNLRISTAKGPDHDGRISYASRAVVLKIQ